MRLLLQYVDKYKLGYEVTALDSVELPAYDGPVRLDLCASRRDVDMDRITEPGSDMADASGVDR